MEFYRRSGNLVFCGVHFLNMAVSFTFIHSFIHSFKSQIAHSYMHHPVSGINSRILSVSLASHVSTHLTHLSAHLYHHHHSHHPSLLHSFTSGSKSTFSTNPSHLRLFSLPDNGTGPDLSCSSFYF